MTFSRETWRSNSAPGFRLSTTHRRSPAAGLTGLSGCRGQRRSANGRSPTQSRKETDTPGSDGALPASALRGACGERTRCAGRVAIRGTRRGGVRAVPFAAAQEAASSDGI
jgi:hypothetical protein